ncbi:MAG: hypothetical protein KDE27_21820 [Planctomycetes bacterium]|nr:hypothetical protein [Planctomycetota bacterium]
MNRPTSRHPAEERLLDAALQQLIVAAPIATKPLPASRPQRRRLVAAAMFLLGLGVTATMVWQARGSDPGRDRESTPGSGWQDPAAAGTTAKRRAEGRSELAKLPVDTTDLVLWASQPSDLAGLTRLTRLRRLQIAVHSRGRGATLWTKSRAWNEAAADCLAPIAALTELETLSLPGSLRLRPEHLAPLRELGRLRELTLVGTHVALDAELVDALQALRGLRTLHLDIVTLDAAAVERLAALALEEIEISRCPGFDAASFARLCALATLQRVTLGELGRRDFFCDDQSAMLWRAGAQDYPKLAALPALDQLTLRSCAIGRDELRALPTTIRSLSLHGHELAPGDLGELKRFGALRDLHLTTRRYNITLGGIFEKDGDEARADAFAAALGSLRLQSLDYGGTITEALLQQLAGQPDLTRLRLLTGTSVPSLGPLAGAPRLSQLILHENHSPSTLELDDLAPLARSKALRVLTIQTVEPRVSTAELEGVLGPDVRIEVRSAELSVNRSSR